ncbi:hypothetical protein EBR43_06810 [bacterium]|jgi:hypothetical protein|nr:hypothetical protein [bacterium]
MWMTSMLVGLFLHHFNPIIQFIPLIGAALAFKEKLRLYEWLPYLLFFSWWGGISTIELGLQLILLMIIQLYQLMLSLDSKISRFFKLYSLLACYNSMRFIFNSMRDNEIALRFFIEFIIYFVFIMIVNRLYREQVKIFWS